MKYAHLIARILLGLIYFVFGLNGFLQFLPMPPLNEQAMAFMSGLMTGGYFFPLLKATEVIAGAALLAGFFMPLSLIVLAPITLNIFLFHAFLAPENGGVIMPIVMIALHIFLAWGFMGHYKGLLKPK